MYIKSYILIGFIVCCMNQIHAQHAAEINNAYRTLILETYKAPHVRKTGDLLPASPPFDDPKKSAKPNIILVKILLSNNKLVKADIETIFRDQVMQASVPDFFLSVNKDLMRQRIIDTAETILSSNQFYVVGTYTITSVFLPKNQNKSVNVVYFEVIRTGRNKRNYPRTQIVKMEKRQGVWRIAQTETTDMS